MKKIRRYQVALSTPSGISPQKYEFYKTKKEATKICETYNKQLNNPYSIWVVLRKTYLI